MTENIYGIKRVLEPQHVLSTSAWKVDNNREIYPNEIRVSIKKLHLEGTSFKQICIESNNNLEKIKDRIIDIVIKRGKLHNPVTDTGGLLYGVVEKIGDEYDNKKGLKVGMRLSATLHWRRSRSISAGSPRSTWLTIRWMRRVMPFFSMNSPS